MGLSRGFHGWTSTAPPSHLFSPFSSLSSQFFSFVLSFVFLNFFKARRVRPSLSPFIARLMREWCSTSSWRHPCHLVPSAALMRCTRRRLGLIIYWRLNGRRQIPRWMTCHVIPCISSISITFYPPSICTEICPWIHLDLVHAVQPPLLSLPHAIVLLFYNISSLVTSTRSRVAACGHRR